MKSAQVINLWFTVALFVLVYLASCKGKDEVPALSIPSTYDSTNFKANVSTQVAVLAQLKDLVDEVKKGRKGDALVESTLKTLYEAGNPNLPTVGTSYLSQKINPVWLNEIAKASSGTYVPGPPMGEGGVFGTGSSAYLFDENGLEIEQLIEKGQFGSVLYKHANDLLNGTITSQTVDQVLAIIGCNPTFPNTSTNKAAQPDKFFAVYAARRDKNDGNGLYSQLKAQFIKLQAAVNTGDKYVKDRNDAVASIRLILEKINAATIVNYCQSVTSTMSKTTTTDNDKSIALHALGECIGFTHGYKTILNKKITDAQIDEILVLLNAPANGIPTCYKYVTDPGTELPKLNTLINMIKGIYGFTDQEISDFSKNWITEQGR
jgi:hypothetical protein